MTETVGERRLSLSTVFFHSKPFSINGALVGRPSCLCGGIIFKKCVCRSTQREFRRHININSNDSVPWHNSVKLKPPERQRDARTPENAEGVRYSIW
ncbi:hypothetical protein ANN_01026 [Periplaneta americana]|uniref:Uncharacterized protein n=1 Tax=Periplaneta americana TaxID=6978 RepID=A0ABQ8TSF7_PERAM|nr:hypothetical protein ANN_01026 [Periplaneta americana]